MKHTDKRWLKYRAKILKNFRANTLVSRKLGDTSSADQVLIDKFVANPDNPYLISFPRTGSHWLRMLLELYFERPTLVRVFYCPRKTNYLILHSHDDNLDIERRNVIYLYRDPVEMVYSQLHYHEEPLDDWERISYWSRLYGRHLDKWLCWEQFTTKKTILTYEGMRQNLAIEFAKVTAHFGEAFKPERLEQVASRVTKEEVKKRTTHDPQVVQLKTEYQTNRQAFKKNYGTLVWKCVTEGRADLMNYFDSEE